MKMSKVKKGKQMKRRQDLTLRSDTTESSSDDDNPNCAPEAKSALLNDLLHERLKVYQVKVRAVGMEPCISGLGCLVRGYCAHYSCNALYPVVNWEKAGPQNYGKLLQPFCLRCSVGDKRRYLDLSFCLEMIVEDQNGKSCRIIIKREYATRFLGCSIYEYLTDTRCSAKVKRMLLLLLKNCKIDETYQRPRLSFNLQVVQVAEGSPDNIQFHLFGANPSLTELVQAS